MKKLIICLLSAGVLQFAQAQSLYMPRDISQAFKNETRSLDGNPGKNYWQNRASYDITVNAMPPDRNITGTESIRYVNNSPDTLRTLVFKLFLNIHKAGAPRVFGAGQDYLTDGMHIDAYSVNGQKQQWRDRPNLFTWQEQKLATPLAPHDSISVGIDWHYQISLKSNREGMIDSTTYFLAYFYPRIAVFDDYNGWDRMNFIDALEFYSDFNDYRVTLNVPKNYLVWGTGTLQKPETLLQPDQLQKFKESFTSDNTIHVATREDLLAKRVTLQNATNSWQFTASDIPDMAFGISDHFVWDAGSVVVDKNTNRRASVQAAFNDTAKDYHSMVDYGKHSLGWLSGNWPGVPYPYEKTTIFQGYAGMEYPMMANDETYADPLFSRFVAEHEIAHTYMPFYMGINETRYGFMDEGWATTFEFLIGNSDLGKERAVNLFKRFRVDGWINDTYAGEDIPIITPGDAQNGQGLGNNEYGKPALGYLAVKDLLGDDLFRKCLHGYMDRWHGKHPLPWDFFNTFTNVSGKKINWFWNAWFIEPNYIDLAITGVTKNAQGYSIKLKNIGGMPAPTDLTITYANGNTEIKHLAPLVWEKDIHETAYQLVTTKKVTSVVADGGIFMDADESNNVWPLSK